MAVAITNFSVISPDACGSNNFSKIADNRSRFSSPVFHSPVTVLIFPLPIDSSDNTCPRKDLRLVVPAVPASFFRNLTSKFDETDILNDAYLRDSRSSTDRNRGLQANRHEYQRKINLKQVDFLRMKSYRCLLDVIELSVNVSPTTRKWLFCSNSVYVCILTANKSNVVTVLTANKENFVNIALLRRQLDWSIVTPSTLPAYGKYRQVSHMVLSCFFGRGTIQDSKIVCARASIVGSGAVVLNDDHFFLELELDLMLTVRVHSNIMNAKYVNFRPPPSPT